MTPAEIIAALEGLNTLLGFVQKQIAKGRERGEWTAEQDYAFDAKLTEIKSKSHWQSLD